MKIRPKKAVFTISMLIGLFMAGCVPAPAPERKITTEMGLGTTIGSLVEVFAFDLVPVEGYSLVGGLNGTGSEECPADIREYLEKYILKQMPDQKTDIDKLISSHDTAVVAVRGLMPRAASKNELFDVGVAALPNTQTTSLEGGWLYGTELKVAGGFGIAMKILVKAEGPIFIDTLDAATNKRFGHVLAGGKVLNDYQISLAIRDPNYKVANFIRNRLNERFGSGTAKALSDSQIELKIPAKYKRQKERFVLIIKAMYLNQTRELAEERITTFVRILATSPDKDLSEIALETIGNECLSRLAALLNSSNEEVRLRAARCMLNLGNDQGLETLVQITQDKNSPYRVSALEAIISGAGRKDAAATARRLLRDENFDIRLAAYESLRELEDITVSQKLISRSFYLEQITQTERKGIFVSRSGEPRIALFGTPIHCRKNVFIESADGNIIINAPAGQKYISIMRRHPKRPDVVIQLKSSFELGDIIQTLCEEPTRRTEQGRVGLNVSYAEAIALLKQMCDKGAVEAEFRAGPLPKIGMAIKK